MSLKMIRKTTSILCMGMCMREKEGKNKHYNTHFVVSELAGGASEWSGGGSDGGEE